MARRALASTHTAPYGEHAGDLGLRRAIARREGVAVENVLVTSGAQGGLFAVLSAFLGAGDLALVPDPGFPSYRVLSELAGAGVRTYRPGGERWRLDPRTIEEALAADSRVRVVVINHPGNPTGGGASGTALRRVATACAAHGALLVADEVYRDLAFDSAIEIAGLRQVTASGVAVGSIAKAWGAPGLRVGWLIGDPDVLEPCRAWHAWAVTSAAGPSQRAARALIEASEEVVSTSRAALGERWSALVDGWTTELDAPPPRPDAGFYTWFRAPGSAGSAEFCARLAEIERVIVVPGEAFGPAGAGWARLSFGGEPQLVREGARRVARAIARASHEPVRGAVA